MAVALAALTLVLAPSTSRGQDSAAVVVTIEGGRSGAIHVTERLRVAADSADTSARAAFQYLARPCAAIGDVLLDDGVRTVPLAVRANGPWRALEDTVTVSSGARERLTIRYSVQRASDAVDVPLVLPTLPIARTADSRQGNVQVIVRLADARGVVTFPRLERS